MLRYLLIFICVISLKTVAFAQALSLSLPTTLPSRCSSTGSMQTVASGGTAPYSYRLTGTTQNGAAISRPVQNSNTFSNLAGGIYTIIVTDFVGATTSVSGSITSNYTLPNLPTVTVLGTSVRVTGNGGRQPHRYAYMGNSDTTIWTNGHLQASDFFPCLGLVNLTFLTIDSCNNAFPIRNVATMRSPLPQANATLNADNTANITFDTTHYAANYPYNAGYGNGSPYTFVCTSNTGVVTTNQTGRFQNLVGCTFTIAYTDRCGFAYPTQQFNPAYQTLCATTSCFNQQTGTATVVATGGVAPLTYSYQNPITNVTTTNTTGVFTGLLLNRYDYSLKTTDACGNYNQISIYKNTTKNASARCPFDSIIRFSAYDYYRNSYTYPTVGGGLNRFCNQGYLEKSPISVQLLNGATVVAQTTLTSNNINGQFSINSFLPAYQVKFIDACGVVDMVSISTTTTVSATVCSDPAAGTVSLTPRGGQGPYSFQYLGTPANTTGNISGNYTGLPLNQPYQQFRVNDACGSNVVEVYNYFQYNNVQVYSKVVNGVCKSVYALQIQRYGSRIAYPVKVQGGPNMITVYKPNGSFFDGLLPGTYYVSDSCMRDTIVLPTPVYDNLTVNVQTQCSGGAVVTTSGAHPSSYYTNLVNTNTSFGGHASSVNYYNDDYGSNGGSPTVYLGNTFNFTASGVYKMYLIPRGYQFSSECPMDTVTVNVNAYSRPVLTAGFGVLCPGITLGDVCATVAQGAPPFTYTLDPASVPAGYTDPTTITTTNPNYCFPNLPSGSYDLRVNDGCLVNADYNAGVGPYGFSPTYTRACSAPLTLSLPNISGATYQWADSTNAIIGTTPVITTPDIGAATYTATVTISAGCSYTHTIVVPPLPVVTFPYTYIHNCNNTLTIEVEVPSGVKRFVWRDSTNTIIATTEVNNIILPYIGAVNYTVTIDVNSCTYTQAIQIPTIPDPVGIINAGIDTTIYAVDIITFYILNPDPLPGNWIGVWSAINPMDNLADPNRMDTEAMIRDTLEAHIFVYTVTDINGCIYRDTVVVHFIIGEPLPLKLLHFGAQYSANRKSVLTNWRTATEQNTDFFWVERSKNAYDFKPIGKVNAAGNSTTLRDYNYKDENPLLGASYYRLKMMDKDGQFSYSNTVALHSNNETTLWQHYPNPTRGLVNLQTTAATTAHLYNAQSQLLRAIDIQAGTNAVDCSDLAAGVYYLKDTASGKYVKIVKY